jgi:hypothetical protein
MANNCKKTCGCELSHEAARPRNPPTGKQQHLFAWQETEVSMGALSRGGKVAEFDASTSVWYVDGKELPQAPAASTFHLCLTPGSAIQAPAAQGPSLSASPGAITLHLQPAGAQIHIELKPEWSPEGAAFLTELAAARGEGAFYRAEPGFLLQASPPVTCHLSPVTCHLQNTTCPSGLRARAQPHPGYPAGRDGGRQSD